METPNEKHYAPKEVAGMMGISVNTAKRLFRGRRGVLEIPSAKGKNIMMRIPESVLREVYREYSNQRKPQ